jgi:MFS family permease
MQSKRASAPRINYYGWTIVAALGVTTIVSYGVSQYLIGVLVEPIARELGWNKAAINGAYSSTVLVSGLLGFAVGRLLDRFGARAIMSTGSVVLGVALLLLSRMHTLPQFYLIWGAGIGLGTALTYYPVSFTVVANWFERRRMNALSTLTFMGAFSSTFFYPLNGALVSIFGWREAVAILGLIQIVVTLPLHAILIRRHPEDLGLSPDGGEEPATSTAVTSGVSLDQALRSRAFWIISAAISLSYFASTTVITEHIAFLIRRGFSPTLVTTIVGLFGIAYLPGRTIVAIFGRRVPLQLLVAGAFAIEALGIVVLLKAHVTAAIVAYVIAFGAAYGALSPLRGAIMAERFGRRAYGSIIAAQGIPVAFLSALGPVACGRLIDVFGYASSFEACIAALIVGTALMLLPLRTDSDSVRTSS